MKVKISLSKKGSNVIEEIIDEKEDEDEELNDEDHNNDMEDNFLRFWFASKLVWKLKF